MYLATGAEPTNETARISGCCSKASTVPRPPCTRFRTPAGAPVWLNNCASKTPLNGVRSEGLSTKVLPAAMAMGNIHSGIMTGKLKGQIPATTPSGTRTLWLSMPRAICSTVSPIINVGMPQAKSTTSMPRRTSARASSRVLPFSTVNWRANVSKFSCSSCLKRNRYCTRSVTGVSRQAGNARVAACTASLT